MWKPRSTLISSPRSRLPLAVRFALGCVLLGCHLPATTEEGSREITRWIAEEPSQLFRLADLTEPVEVFASNFDKPADLESWIVAPSGASVDDWIDDGALGSVAAKYPRLIHNGPLQTDRIDTIEIALSGLDTGRLRLFWSESKEAFHRSKNINMKVREGATKYIFEVSNHAQWRGPVEKLRLDVQSDSESYVRLHSVRGLSADLDVEELSRAADTVWRVELDNEIRSAVLATPTSPIERELTVPADGVLRFAYGVQPRPRSEVDFRVTLRDAQKEPVPLFLEQLTPESPIGWAEGSVDLAAYAGRQVRIALEVAVSGTSRIETVFWSDPIVLSARDESALPNVVLIVVDTLRADRLSSYGHGRPTSPQIDRWARDNATLFQHTVAASPWTLPAHISLFTGLSPLRHRYNHHHPLPIESLTLAERMRAAGYETLAITGGAYLHPEYGLDQGFDRFRYWPSGSGQYSELEYGTATALEWLGERRERPFFLFFHTYEVHAPFHPRQPFLDSFPGCEGGEAIGQRLRGRSVTVSPEDGFALRRKYVLEEDANVPQEDLKPESLNEVGCLYDSGVAYADSLIGRLLERLEGKKNLVVLTSDHGEALGERSLAAHNYLYDFNLMVPLLIALPDGLGAGQKVTQQVRSIDILPTILDAVSEPSAEEIDGRSLIPLIRGDNQNFPREAWAYASSSNFGIGLRVANRYKYIYNNSAWSALSGNEELYRLAEDPDEETNLAPGAAEVERARAATIEHYRESFRGLHFQVASESDRPFDMRIFGVFLRPWTIKTTDLDGAELEWSYRPRSVTISVPPGSHPSLDFEAVTGLETLTVELDPGSRQPGCRHRIELADLQEPLEIDLAASQCSGPDLKGSVNLRFEGPVAAPAPPRVTDPELANKLRALGYLGSEE